MIKKALIFTLLMGVSALPAFAIKKGPYYVFIEKLAFKLKVPKEEVKATLKKSFATPLRNYTTASETNQYMKDISPLTSRGNQKRALSFILHHYELLDKDVLPPKWKSPIQSTARELIEGDAIYLRTFVSYFNEASGYLIKPQAFKALFIQYLQRVDPSEFGFDGHKPITTEIFSKLPYKKQFRIIFQLALNPHFYMKELGLHTFKKPDLFYKAYMSMMNSLVPGKIPRPIDTDSFKFKDYLVLTRSKRLFGVYPQTFEKEYSIGLRKALEAVPNMPEIFDDLIALSKVESPRFTITYLVNLSPKNKLKVFKFIYDEARYELDPELYETLQKLMPTKKTRTNQQMKSILYNLMDFGDDRIIQNLANDLFSKKHLESDPDFIRAIHETLQMGNFISCQEALK